MKIIFLDIDGVLNSKEWAWRRDTTYVPRFDNDSWLQTHWHDIQQLDPQAIKRLNNIVEATGAYLVLSSTWRIVTPLTRMLDFMRHVANSAGFRFNGEFLGATPALSTERGYEIQKWLSAFDVPPKFIILDDSDDMGPVLPRLVRTSWDKGLLDEHVQIAVKLLNE